MKNNKYREQFYNELKPLMVKLLIATLKRKKELEARK